MRHFFVTMITLVFATVAFGATNQQNLTASQRKALIEAQKRKQKSARDSRRNTSQTNQRSMNIQKTRQQTQQATSSSSSNSGRYEGSSKTDKAVRVVSDAVTVTNNAPPSTPTANFGTSTCPYKKTGMLSSRDGAYTQKTQNQQPRTGVNNSTTTI